jgi:peptidoglycan hydrolase-like protein with peptidoglycan-binding domain
MATIPLGTFMQIGFRLLQNREEIGKTWGQLEPIIRQAIAAAPQLKELAQKLAPEMLQGTMTASAGEPTYDVRWVQSGLNQVMNAGLEVDGDMGPVTGEAIKKFQAANNLVVDGWMGTATAAALDAALKKA